MTTSTMRAVGANRVAGARIAGVRVQSKQRQCSAVVLLFLFVTCLLFAVAPASLRLLYPALAAAAAVFLFAQSRPRYVSFVLWLWFLSPFLRRLVDYRAGFVPSNPLLMAPLLATSVSGYLLLKNIRSLSQPSTLPFSCAIAGILFGGVIGFVHYPVIAVMQALAAWLTPVLFAFLLFHDLENRRQYQATLERALLYGLLVLGGYGVYQFFFLPAWDRDWLIGLGSGPFGGHVAGDVRVFSMVNSPAACGVLMMFGILTLFGVSSRLRNLAILAAFLTLILSASRSSYLGLAAGVLYLAFSLSSKARFRLVFSLVVSTLLLMAAMTVPEVNAVVSARFRSMEDPSQDVSYKARIYGHALAFAKLAHEPLGEGMGSTETDHATTGKDDSLGPHDSTILEFLYSLGVPGTIVYSIGFMAAFSRIFAQRGRSSDFKAVLRSSLVGYMAVSLLNSVVLGFHGMWLWICIGMGLNALDGEPR